MPGDGVDVVPLRTERPWAALGLVVGPVAFVSAWAVGGSRMPEPYSPVSDAISRIAAVGSPERVLMTVGFVIYGAAVLAGSAAVRRSPLHRAWPFVAVNALATLAVAATPLDHSDRVDLLHGVFATIGYASITLVPLVSAGPLRRLGHRGAADLSVVAGVVSGLCLAATTVSASKGAFQRGGLGAGDLWLLTTGIVLWRSRVRDRAAA